MSPDTSGSHSHHHTSRTALSFARSMAYTALAGLISLAALVPLYWVITTSLKTRREVTFNPLGPPDWRDLQFGNYPTAWDQGHFSVYFTNSLIVVIPTVLGVMTLAMLAAYAFAIFRFRGREPLFALFLFGLTIPIGVLVIPLFYQMLNWKLINTHWALILPQVAIGLPFSILLLRTFIQELPHEILDAALIDGCGVGGLLVRIVLPLSRPALLTLLVFNFMWNWNQFLLPVILIQTEAVRTLPLGLVYFQGRYASDLPLLMAGAAISFLPVLVIYVIFQRHFIRGIAAGALSGH